ncbi:hypothetical protein [Streptococcus danieliae]|uniref:Uncharacterized protein n=1 Tax=Streptococcus danieliae TaxID=747656 RepID=A0A7Z0M6M5_9STRE|nr:hypothetical protein [Streptococcus danieliae]MBF0699505.1 hypothetical protein [Streptococcus danieliae]NYS96681.1 hypothetical protein [Streptococcus danieliae]
MTQKRDKQIGAVAALAILTIILFTIYQGFNKDKQNIENQLLGEKAAIVTLDTKKNKDETLLKAIQKGQTLKNYEKLENRKKTVFEEYFKLSKELLAAEKEKQAKEVEKLREKIDDVMVLGESRELFFYRGSDWKMVLNRQIPDFTFTVQAADSISIVDGEGRTVLLMKVWYNEEANKFQLLSMVKTFEWWAPTDVFVPGSGEVGVLSSSEQGKDGDNQ